MQDPPNDMWAVGTTLFQLLMSGHPAWKEEFGPFMFGPSDHDTAEREELQNEKEWVALTAPKIQAQQELWVRLWCQVLQLAEDVLHVLP